MTARVPLRTLGAAAFAAALLIGAGPAHARTLLACHVGHGCYPRIQDAVDAARPGDTVRVEHGTWHEGVRVVGHRKDRIRLLGDPRLPARVVLEGRGLRGEQSGNGVFVSHADGVTVDGFTARNYQANGFYATDVDGYRFTNLVARKVGEYGLFAFNSKGGSMTNSTAYYNNDSGFYVGQTPVQSKPKRTVVSNVTSWGNVLGFSGTNMRYTTISRSRFYDNGAGIVPNALDTERFPPDEDNRIVDNEVFWNNFDYYRGAPFKVHDTNIGEGEVPYPVGVGILLLSGRRTVIEHNRVFGNYLGGIALIPNVLLKSKAKAALTGNVVSQNRFGLDGSDLNGRDLVYDGSGSGNCFAENVGVLTTFPADGSTIAPCEPPPGANAFNESAQTEALTWALEQTHEANWIRHPHARRPGLRPLEHYRK